MKKTKNIAHKSAYDVLVIGGGSAGISAAIAARQAGATVAMIAADKMGGECPNYACVPTKSMLVAALRYNDFKRNALKFGINARSITLDVEAMMARKDAVVTAMTGRHRIEKILEKEGITLFRGVASFVDDESVKVGTHLISAKSFVIATGSIPKIPPIAGIESLDYWTPREAVSFSELPASIAIVGGGSVGSEFATFFSLCDVPVVMFDIAPQLLPREDAENAAFAERELKHRGVAFHSNTKVLSVTKDRNRLRVTYQTGDSPRQTLRVSTLLIASGRTPNIESLRLENVGIITPNPNAQLAQGVIADRSSGNPRSPAVPHIFYAGDVTGLPAYTHTAHHEGVIAGTNAAHVAQGKRSFKKFDLRVVPRVTFVSPELASVGMMSDELIAAKEQFTIWKFPVGALGRAVIESERVGLLKVFVSKKTNLILGASMLGSSAGEVIHELALAMHANIDFDTVTSMIHAYPTMSETIPGLMSA